MTARLVLVALLLGLAVPATAEQSATCEQEKAALVAVSRQLADEAALVRYLSERRLDTERAVAAIGARLLCNGPILSCVDGVLAQLAEAKAKAAKPDAAKP
jgi:hypothetical protein